MSRMQKVLTDEDVYRIRSLYKQGKTQQEIADLFGIAQGTVKHKLGEVSLIAYLWDIDAQNRRGCLNCQVPNACTPRHPLCTANGRKR